MRKNFLLATNSDIRLAALLKGESWMDFWPRLFDAAIMKNIRQIVVATLVSSLGLLATVQPVLAQGMFIEKVVAATEVAPLDSELKQILPLVLNETSEAKKPEEEEAQDLGTELFAPILVDEDHGMIHKSMSAEKVLPIEDNSITGISTYFSRFHPGLDYRAKLGTPIRAVLPGIVNEVGYQRGGYGQYIVLTHYLEEKTVFSLYAHLKDINVKPGETIETKDVIGTVGLTGRTTGPHLHFELHDAKSAMDPLKFFANKSLAMMIKK